MNEKVLIAGLGNVGDKYEMTRHNAGFIAIDEFVETTEEMGQWVSRGDWQCHLSEGTINGVAVKAVKPTTLMNDSGKAIDAVARFHKINPEHILVIHDELDIDFGKIRTRFGGSDAGNNGIKSTTKELDTEDYGRVRIGIGPKTPPRIDSVKYVLGRFSKDQQAELPKMTREVAAIIHEYLASRNLPHETRSFLI